MCFRVSSHYSGVQRKISDRIGGVLRAEKLCHFYCVRVVLLLFNGAKSVLQLLYQFLMRKPVLIKNTVNTDRISILVNGDGF